MVYSETQSHHCFGCKESGDVIQFVRKYDNLSFVDAVEALANSVNMPMPQKEDCDLAEIEKRKKERAQILACLKESAKFYYSCYRGKTGQALIAREYTDKRKLENTTLVRFGVGCSPDFLSLPNHLTKCGYSPAIIEASGMCSRGKNGELIDFFAKRLMFPIIDKDGAVIGFSGRLLESKEAAKYKNTSATSVFNKSEVIFGINLLKKLREEKREKNDYSGIERIIIVEGQIDVMMMHQFGFTSTVACLGTALTPIHARRLKQFSENIVLLLDGDSAGQKATMRSIDVLRKGGINVTVAKLPTGLDPDEFLRTYGKEEMQKLLDNAVEGISVKINALAENYQLTEPSECAHFVQESLKVLKELDTESEQDSYLSIIHSFSSTPIEVLRLDLKKLKVDKTPLRDEIEESEPTAPIKKDGYTLADQFILASILNHKSYTDGVDISDLQFFDDGLKKCYQYILDARSKNIVPTVGGLFSVVDVENSTALLKEVVNYEFVPDPFPELSFASCVLRNRERAIKKQKDEAQKKCSTATDTLARDMAMKTVIQLTKKLEELKTQFEEYQTQYSTKRLSLSKQKQKKHKDN